MSEFAPHSRQNVFSRDPQELEIRTRDTGQLVHDIVGRHQEFFADPQNRVDFLKAQSADDFLHLAQYANAKLRGKRPHQLRHDENERGGYLTSLHTPSAEDKPLAFKNGYQAIQDYLETSDDSLEKKIEGAAMAVEALVIWVHPFNDGNGRTSRFMGKLIEDGATDMSELINETAVKGVRGRYYKRDGSLTREGMLSRANNTDIFFDDDPAEDELEREKLREQAEQLPPDVIGIAHDIKHLLESDIARQQTVAHKNRDKASAAKFVA